jgi:hypothetical protein
VSIHDEASLKLESEALDRFADAMGAYAEATHIGDAGEAVRQASELMTLYSEAVQR